MMKAKIDSKPNDTPAKASDTAEPRKALRV
jgi:hypothetical protein